MLTSAHRDDSTYIIRASLPRVKVCRGWNKEEL